MAMTYEFDVAPHLYRAKALRTRRLERWHHLHKHDGRGPAWRFAIMGLLVFWAVVAGGIYLLL
jgi:hypothetical protein